MADALITDQEIALLCEVLEGHGANLNADKTKILDRLIAKGFVMATDQESPEKYKLTGKAQQLLAERGVGLSGGQRLCMAGDLLVFLRDEDPHLTARSGIVDRIARGPVPS
jgi:hypothetical protein